MDVEKFIIDGVESAVKTSEMNMKDTYRAKRQADLNAEARRMLDPSQGRNLVDLDKFRPIELPEWSCPTVSNSP